MLPIKTIIIEDNPKTRKVIELGFEKYNSESTDWEILLVGEAESFESADAIVKNQDENEPIRLAFLDLTLKDGKTGIDFIKKYPQIAYIIISRDRNALIEITKKTASPQIYDYVLKIAEGSFDLNDIVKSIQKFVRDKGDKLYVSTLKLGWKTVIVNDIAFVSKKPLRVSSTGNRKIIEECSVCLKKPEHQNDSLYISANSVDLSADHQGCLHKLYQGTSSEENRSIKNFIEANKLSPDKFIRVSQSTIINLKYVAHLDSTELLISIVDLGTAALKSSANYLDKTTLRKVAERHT
jgi:DNA-binding LytR/AlgR family response regulator